MSDEFEIGLPEEYLNPTQLIHVSRTEEETYTLGEAVEIVCGLAYDMCGGLHPDEMGLMRELVSKTQVAIKQLATSKHQGVRVREVHVDKPHNAFEKRRVWWKKRGAELKHWRKEAGLTQKDLGLLTGITQNVVSMIETGKWSGGAKNYATLWDAVQKYMGTDAPMPPLDAPEWGSNFDHPVHG